MKLSNKELNILAAMFARSNMGMAPPTDKHIARLKSCRTIKLDSAVEDICGQFIETNEHFEIFYAEAKSWVKYLKHEEDARTIHKDIFEQFERA